MFQSRTTVLIKGVQKKSVLGLLDVSFILLNCAAHPSALCWWLGEQDETAPSGCGWELFIMNADGRGGLQ